MFKNITIKLKLVVIVVSAIFMISTITIVQSMYSIQQLSEHNIEKYREEAYKSKENELKNYSSVALKTIESYYNRTTPENIKKEVSSYLQDKSSSLFGIIENQYEKYKDIMTEEELKEHIKAIVKSARYEDNGYFWINNTDFIILEHPIRPELIGMDLSELKDETGRYLIKEFVKVATTKGSGFVTYMWEKPNYDTAQEKISYVKMFKPYNWIIGTGAYVGDVPTKMKEQAIKSIKAINYGENGYFWINDTAPKMIMHPKKPSLDGKDLSGVKDENGVYLFNEMVKVCNKDGKGLVKYSWSKPVTNTVEPKFSYVQLFKPWGWIIGTGAYVDDIETRVKLMGKETNEKINSMIIQVAVVSVIVSLLFIFIVLFFINSIVLQPLENINTAIKQLISSVSKSSTTIEKQSNDEIGEVIDSFNQYLQKINKDIKDDMAFIQEVEHVMNHVQNGVLSQKITLDTENEVLQKLKYTINDGLNTLESNFSKINIILQEYAQYKYTNKVTLDSYAKDGIFDLLLVNINAIQGAINDMLLEASKNGIILDTSAKKLLENVDVLNNSSSKAGHSLNETISEVGKMTLNIEQNTQNTMQMTEYTKSLTNSSKEGRDLASKTTEAMDQINEEVTAINNAISIIDQIAFQTNILSLNAAVEASTAGDAGKGFAVVAHEVRNLAAKSSEASNEIKALVLRAIDKADIGKSISDKMIKGYDRLNQDISDTIGLIKNLESSSKDQNGAIVKINDAMSQLDSQVQQNTDAINKTKDIAIQTYDIASDIVKSSDEKEFIGKENLVKS